MIKAIAGRWLFRAANIRQLHIVGTSRSGTTMLHVAMTAFQNVDVFPRETPVNVPRLGQRWAVCRTFLAAGTDLSARKFFVTKRDWRWWTDENIEGIVRKFHEEDLGLILMLRDPRDVLLSEHRIRPGRPFLSPAGWARQTVAGERLIERLQGEAGFMTIRYEDLVMRPEAAEAELCRRYGLSPHPDSAGLGHIGRNVNLHPGLGEQLTKALNGVRDMSPASVGKWRRQEGDPAAPLLADSEIAPIFERYCHAHDYMLAIES